LTEEAAIDFDIRGRRARQKKIVRAKKFDCEKKEIASNGRRRRQISPQEEERFDRDDRRRQI
jgi:hypothetical protein